MTEPTEQKKDETVRSIFERIERESISPRPRWHFLFREGVVISLGVFAVTVGSLAVAAILFEMRNAWWGFYDATHESFLGFFVDALPYVWLVGFALFAAVAYLSVRYTKRGYRYPLHIILGSSVALSGVCGVIFYSTGFGAFIDEDMGSFVPLGHSLLDRESALWRMPQNGRIAGIVREIPYAEPVVWLESIDRVPYKIDVTDFSLSDRAVLRIGDVVRVVGVPTTTPGVLHGCLFLMRSDDVLRHVHSMMRRGETDAGEAHTRERNILSARSTLCKGVRSFARLVPNDN